MDKGNWYCAVDKENKNKKIIGIITSISYHFNLIIDEEKNTVTIERNFKPVFVKKGFTDSSIEDIIHSFLKTLRNYIDVCIHVKSGTKIGKINIERINDGRRGLLAVTENYYGNNTRTNK